MKEMPKLLSISQAAKVANTTRERVYHAIGRGELTPTITEPVVLLDAAQVETWGAQPKSKGGYPKGKPRKQATGEGEQG